MRKTLLNIALVVLPALAGAQELFPVAEPASNVPKGVLGLRLYDETFNEVDRIRNLFALRIMYGVTPKLTVYAIPNASNHHNAQLPPEFPVHNTPQIGVTHPYRFNGVDFYAKYRFLSLDGQNSHFRAALYGEYSILKVAHDEAEPTLLDDNSGVGGGLITTYLKNHFAVSFTGGYIHPWKYKGDVPDPIPGLPGVPATVTYADGYNYSLSFGYLLFPHTYTGYNQTNWNVYLEFVGKDYGAMQMQVGNVYYNLPQYAISTAGNKALAANQYLEVYPGVQTIIRSDIRVDFSVGFPVVSRSWVHYYPVYNLAVQRYFYFHKKKQT
jgi:hypothetical protein